MENVSLVKGNLFCLNLSSYTKDEVSLFTKHFAISLCVRGVWAKGKQSRAHSFKHTKKTLYTFKQSVCCIGNIKVIKKKQRGRRKWKKKENWESQQLQLEAFLVLENSGIVNYNKMPATIPLVSGWQMWLQTALPKRGTDRIFIGFSRTQLLLSEDLRKNWRLES